MSSIKAGNKKDHQKMRIRAFPVSRRWRGRERERERVTHSVQKMSRRRSRPAGSTHDSLDTTPAPAVPARGGTWPAVPSSSLPDWWNPGDADIHGREGQIEGEKEGTQGNWLNLGSLAPSNSRKYFIKDMTDLTQVMLISLAGRDKIDGEKKGQWEVDLTLALLH